MVARAFAGASGKTWSRTSPRVREDAEVLGEFADGNVSTRTEAGEGATTGDLAGWAPGFFSAAAIGEVRVVEGADGFKSEGGSRRTGCSTGLDGSAGWAGGGAAGGGGVGG